MNLSETQFIKLKEQVHYVSQHSPFYRALFKEHSIQLETLHSLADFQKIPFTTKADLQTQYAEFICVAKNKLIDHVATSGTMGRAVTLALTDNDLNRLALNECNSFKTAGLNANDLIQLMTTMDKRFMAGLAYFLGARKLGAGIIRVGNGLPELQWDNILELKPSVIICVPSFILKLIDYAEKHQIDYKNSSIKKAICIGEAIRTKEFTLNTLGTKIMQAWPLDLYSTYASSEMASAFTECTAKKGGHLQEDLLVIEIIGDNDLPVKFGEAGELVITTLGIEGMPLIRFKTGDICMAHNEACSCGNNSVRLSPVLGRKNQMIKYKGTSLYPAAIYEVLENNSDIEQYQLEVSSSEVETDEIRIYYSIYEQADQKRIESELINTFRSKLSVVPKFSLMVSDELKKRIFPETSRKPITFIDRRNN